MFKDVILEARDVWKSYEVGDGIYKWILCGTNIEVAKGDLISILGNSGMGKSLLLKVLGLREPVERGAVFFEGRLVNNADSSKLTTLQDGRILLFSELIEIDKLEDLSYQQIAVLLLDEPKSLVDINQSAEKWDELRALTRSGIAIIIATREATVAAHTDVSYKLVDGKLIKITGMFKP